jgi:hypothetical protein
MNPATTAWRALRHPTDLPATETSTEQLFEPWSKVALISLDIDQFVAAGRATHQRHGRVPPRILARLRRSFR